MLLVSPEQRGSSSCAAAPFWGAEYESFVAPKVRLLKTRDKRSVYYCFPVKNDLKSHIFEVALKKR